MPLYDFKHPTKEEYIEIFFNMDEEKAYFDEDGLEWQRIFALINVAPTYRSFDEKKQVDKDGNPMVIKKISNEFAASQGFDNAFDYVEWSNSQVDESKTPTANREKMRDQMSKKETKELIEHNKESQKKDEKIKAKARAETRKQAKGNKLKINSMKKTIDKIQGKK
jgi:hypothetical protein